MLHPSSHTGEEYDAPEAQDTQEPETYDEEVFDDASPVRRERMVRGESIARGIGYVNLALGAAAVAVLSVKALESLSDRWLEHERAREGDRDRARSTSSSTEVRVEHVVTVNMAIDEVYRFWRDIANFPRFMRHIESVQVKDDTHSRWRAKGPAGATIEWEAELLVARENEWIAWRSIEGSAVENSGSVRFTPAPGGRGTEVRVQLQYRPPGGAFGHGLAWLLGEAPEQQVREDLHRFKQILETGEIPLSDGPGLWRAAQPAEHPEEVRELAGVRA